MCIHLFNSLDLARWKVDGISRYKQISPPESPLTNLSDDRGKKKYSFMQGDQSCLERMALTDMDSHAGKVSVKNVVVSLVSRNIHLSSSSRKLIFPF